MADSYSPERTSPFATSISTIGEMADVSNRFPVDNPIEGPVRSRDAQCFVEYGNILLRIDANADFVYDFTAREIETQSTLSQPVLQSLLYAGCEEVSKEQR